MDEGGCPSSCVYRCRKVGDLRPGHLPGNDNEVLAVVDSSYLRQNILKEFEAIGYIKFLYIGLAPTLDNSC